MNPQEDSKIVKQKDTKKGWEDQTDFGKLYNRH